MADTIPAVFQVLSACLEFSPTSVEASALIRPFPNDPESPLPPSRLTNAIYYDIWPEEAPDAGYQVFASSDPTASSVNSATSALHGSCYPNQEIWTTPQIVATPHSGDRSFRLTSALTRLQPLAVVGASPSVSSFLQYKRILFCYGPGCETYAHRIQPFLYLDGSGYPRSTLRQARIYLVPRPKIPVLLDEYKGNPLRRQKDLTIELRVSYTLVRTGRRYGIAEAPAVILNRS